MINKFLVIMVISLCTVFSQTKDAYETGDGNSGTAKKGLLDPSRFSMQNSVSFGMMSSSLSSTSDLKSQSLYTTMLQYKFSAPVTVNLNFGLPIHSTVSSTQNLNVNNIQSLDYFKSMPLSGSVTWQPKENLMFKINIEHNTGNSLYNHNYFPGYFRQGSIFADSSSIFGSRGF